MLAGLRLTHGCVPSTVGGLVSSCPLGALLDSTRSGFQVWSMWELARNVKLESSAPDILDQNH